MIRFYGVTNGCFLKTFGLLQVQSGGKKDDDEEKEHLDFGEEVMRGREGGVGCGRVVADFSPEGKKQAEEPTGSAGSR